MSLLNLLWDKSPPSIHPPRDCESREGLGTRVQGYKTGLSEFFRPSDVPSSDVRITPLSCRSRSPNPVRTRVPSRRPRYERPSVPPFPHRFVSGPFEFRASRRPGVFGDTDRPGVDRQEGKIGETRFDTERSTHWGAGLGHFGCPTSPVPARCRTQPLYGSDRVPLGPGGLLVVLSSSVSKGGRRLGLSDVGGNKWDRRGRPSTPLTPRASLHFVFRSSVLPSGLPSGRLGSPEGSRLPGPGSRVGPGR